MRVEARGEFETRITDELAEFIADRDSVYLATASAVGRPYMQHRGGPKGFTVVSYLHPDYRESMGSPEAWDAFQLKVVEYLDHALSKRRGPER